MPPMSRPEPFNPIRLEVYRHLFFSIAEEMGTVLKRTAYSPNIKERRDYSCAVFDGQGQLVAMGDHMPVHLGSMPLSVKAALEAAPMIPGDVVIVNDPFSGGTHLPDITMVAPVYRPSPDFDRPLFFVASRAHHSDIGGMTPGSMPLSQEIFQEGVIIPPLKLYEAGDLNRSLLRLLLHNVRTPVEREGDLAAQVGSLRVGEKRLLELMERNGADELETYVKALQDYSERMVRKLIAAIPDGEYSAEDFLDDEGMSERTSRQVKIKVTVKVKGDSMCVDFSGTDAQVQGSLNAVRAITVSAVFYIIRCLASDEVPSTAGLLRPVEVLAPQQSVVNASYPCATAGGNVETSQRIVDVVLRALAHAMPERIPAASSGTMNNLAMGGLRPSGQQPFSYYETIGGGMGAGPHGKGDNGIHTHMTNSLNTPIEALESEFPMRVREYRLRANSGGRGKHRGGDGLIRSLEMLTAARVTMLSERRKLSPYGLSGGGSGKKGMNFVTLLGRRKKLPGKFTMDLGRGDILTIETPGGGAWGGSEKGRRTTAKRRRDTSPATQAPSQKSEVPPIAAAQKKPLAKDQKAPDKKAEARDKAGKGEPAPASRATAAKARPKGQEEPGPQSPKRPPKRPKPAPPSETSAESPKQSASARPPRSDRKAAADGQADKASARAPDSEKKAGKAKPKTDRPQAREKKARPDSGTSQDTRLPEAGPVDAEGSDLQSPSDSKLQATAAQPPRTQTPPDEPAKGQSKAQKSSEPLLPLFPPPQVQPPPQPDDDSPGDKPEDQRDSMPAALPAQAKPPSEGSKPPQRPAAKSPGTASQISPSAPAQAQQPPRSQEAPPGDKPPSRESGSKPQGATSQPPAPAPPQKQGTARLPDSQKAGSREEPPQSPQLEIWTSPPQTEPGPATDKPAASPSEGAPETQAKADGFSQKKGGKANPQDGQDE